MATTTDTLYDRLGGEDAIAQVTTGFYGRVLQDPVLAPYFEGVNMDRQSAMLTAFLVMAVTGDPDAYPGRSMRQAHEGLNIGDAEFDAVVGHLGAVLAGAGVSGDDIAAVAAVAETVRDDVTGR
jgi:hemoglobin